MDSDRIEGNIKEAEGKLTDDELREAEGKTQGGFGKAKDELREGWEDVKEKVHDLTDDEPQRPEDAM